MLVVVVVVRKGGKNGRGLQAGSSTGCIGDSCYCSGGMRGGGVLDDASGGVVW